MVNAEDIKSRLRALEFLPDSADFPEGESLMDAMVLDSLRLMELVVVLESHFHIKVDQDDLAPENFETLNDIAAYVNRRQAVAGG